MQVLEFSPQRGFYQFYLEHLSTELHAHPALEILYTPKGTFSLTTDQGRQDSLQFAIIQANVNHAVTAHEVQLHTLLIEHHQSQVLGTLQTLGISLSSGLFISQDPNLGPQLHAILSPQLTSDSLGQDYDSRVQAIIQYLHAHPLGYQDMLPALSARVHLSASRLSHLFKQEVGLSLKKYLLWCKLKSAIHQHLHASQDLLDSLYANGFYDQPHFSRAFKTMMGVQPTFAYNSRTVQGPGSQKA
ncbi:MAG: AraC family transcriptional regulator [Bacteroidota bacterium]